MESSLGVRKGAWTEEEDLLLRQYVHKYGEGKWYQIPLRAGTTYYRSIEARHRSIRSVVFFSLELFTLTDENGKLVYIGFLQLAGLNRCRKSCRLRWLNYLKPNIKRGGFTADEVDLMIKLHKLLGNRQV
jgi:hypothetical protein